MTSPWMKFYPSDRQSDPMLRCCSIAARGLWVEMMCLIHKAEPYGSLLVNGARIDKRKLAVLVGISEKECSALLMELEGNGVFSRDDDGTLYSRRMRRDFAKAEQDKVNGKRGGNPTVKGGVNPQPNPPDNGGVKAQKLEARSQIPESERKKTRASALADPWSEDDWENFWSRYPNRVGKADARKAFERMTSKAAPDQIFPALQRYANKTDDRPFCNPSTWLNQERWLDQPAETNGKRNQHTSSERRVAGSDFFAGINSLAQDFAGDCEHSRTQPNEVPRGRIEIDG